MKKCVLVLVLLFAFTGCSSDDTISEEQQAQMENELLPKIVTENAYWKIVKESTDGGESYLEVTDNSSNIFMMKFYDNVNSSFEEESNYADLRLTGYERKEPFDVIKSNRIRLKESNWDVIFLEIDNDKATIAVDMDGRNYLIYKTEKEIIFH